MPDDKEEYWKNIIVNLTLDECVELLMNRGHYIFGVTSLWILLERQFKKYGKTYHDYSRIRETHLKKIENGQFQNGRNTYIS